MKVFSKSKKPAGKKTVTITTESKPQAPKMVGLLRLEHTKENYEKIERFRKFLEARDQEHECAVEKNPNNNRYFFFFRVPAGTDARAIKADWNKNGFELPADIEVDGNPEGQDEMQPEEGEEEADGNR